MALAAILGRKTETRRPLSPQPDWSSEVRHTRLDGMIWPIGSMGQQCGMALPLSRLPFGLPGQRLWLREPGRVVDISQSAEESVHFTVEYLADKARCGLHLPERFDPQETNVWPSWVKEGHGIPNGIFREAARFKTVVTAARVERLWDITEAGAKAEGFESREAFLCAWDGIYGKRPGLRQVLNPWVSVTSWDKMVPA